MGSRTVCFIDKEGNTTVCTMEMLSNQQINKVFTGGIIKCSECGFYKQYKGKEKETFSYTEWTGELNE